MLHTILSEFTYTHLPFEGRIMARPSCIPISPGSLLVDHFCQLPLGRRLNLLVSMMEPHWSFLPDVVVCNWPPGVPLLSSGVPLLSPGVPLLSPGVTPLSPGSGLPLLVSIMMPKCSCPPAPVVCNLPPGTLCLLVPAYLHSFRILSPLVAAVYICLLFLNKVMAPLPGHPSRVLQGVLYTLLAVSAILFYSPAGDPPSPPYTYCPHITFACL